ncbi:MAG TPA: universal stress protein [Caulobacteraceae bacterium]|nr:universal stress protein [Caulobacteraceae bacterium]
MFRTVLLAYDGTREGALALREGALLAKACGAHVHVLCVVPQTAGVQVAEAASAGVVAQLTEGHRRLLDTACERLRSLGFSPDTHLVVGEPAPTIGALAHQIGADLVVVGHRHQTALSRWWSGSTDAYLSEHVGCSLLLSSNPISDEAFENEVRATAEA